MGPDETMELVVGGPTAMFPEGSLSGYGSGFGDHENQYIWQSTVWHDKLYLGTFDTSSLLEPLGQFVNGDLLRMSKEEWVSQLGYIRTAIQVATSKLADRLAGTNGADPAALPSEDQALALVRQAAADAGQRWSAQQAAAQENGRAAETWTISLTADQVDSLVQAITSGQLVPGSLSEAQAGQLLDLSQELDQCTALLDQHAPEALLELYQDLNDKVEACNGVLKMAYRKLVNNNLLQNIQSYITCVKYLTTAERGFGMYVSDDGIHFDQITDNGFGDPYNHGLRVFAPPMTTCSSAPPTPLWAPRSGAPPSPLRPRAPGLNRPAPPAPSLISWGACSPADPPLHLPRRHPRRGFLLVLALCDFLTLTRAGSSGIIL